MEAKYKKWYIIVSLLFSAWVMNFVDGFLQLQYLYKSILKLILFLGIPMGYFMLYREERHHLKTIITPRKKDFVSALLFGICVYAVILLAYFILRGHIDLFVIRDQLTSGIGVNEDNFLYVAIYISFVNSFLEELFFRGYAFLILKKETSRWFAYLFSALLFAVYHVGMTSKWFHWGIYLLALAGLFVGGCIFNFLNDRCENIYPSWLVHMCANFAINTVGFLLFGLL